MASMRQLPRYEIDLHDKCVMLNKGSKPIDLTMYYYNSSEIPAKMGELAENSSLSIENMKGRGDQFSGMF